MAHRTPPPPPPPPEDDDEDNEENEEDKDDCEGKGTGSSLDFATGNLKVEHTLVPYRAGRDFRGLRFMYTLRGAQPQATVRTRFLRNEANAAGPQPGAPPGVGPRISMGTRVTGRIDGQQVYFKESAKSQALFNENSIYFVDSIIPFSLDPPFETNFESLDLSTGVYEVLMNVFGVRVLRGRIGPTGSFRLRDSPRKLLIWNARNSELGVGWGLPDVSRLYLGSSTEYVLIATGSGSMKAFGIPEGGIGTATSPEGDLSTLDFLADGSFEHTQASGEVDVYSPEGLLLSRTDLLSGTTDFVYDTSFRLIEVVDPDGFATELAYDGAWLEAVTDPVGRVTQFVHDEEGRLEQIIGPGGVSRSFVYDEFDRMTAQSNGVGDTTFYTFNDRLGSLASVLLPDGTLRAVSPDVVDSQLRGARRLSDVNYDNYDPRSESSLVDGKGNRFEYETNSFGQEIRAVGPDGATVTSEYDGEGNILERSVPSGLVLSYTWDEAGENVIGITGVDSADGTTTSLAIDYDEASGRPSEIVLPDGSSASMTWNAQGLPSSSTNPAGGVVTYDYDAEGNLTSMTNPLGATSTWARDALGRPTLLTDPDGHSVGYSYDDVGRTSEIVDASGAIRSLEWNEDNTLASVTDAGGGVTDYGYDTVGRRVSNTDPLGRVVTFVYDGRNRLIERSDPSGLQSFEWDSNNNMTAWVRQNGDRNSFQFDAYDRPVRIELATGGVTTYSYNLAGRLTETTNDECTLTFEYDGHGRLLRETRIPNRLDLPAQELNYEYDDKGRRTSLSTASGRAISYLWADSDHLASVSEDGVVVDIAFDEGGRPESMNYGGVLSASYLWSPGARLEDLDYQVDSNSVFGWAYTYNGSGLRDTRQDLDNAVATYSYDVLGALAAVEHSGPTADESYSYDAMGNRLSDHRNSSYVYDASYRLLEDDSFTYSWTVNGDLETRTTKSNGEVTSYSWNSSGRLTGLQRTSSQGILLADVAYFYDPFGRRIERRVDGQQFFYNYDRQTLLEESTSDGLPTARYVYSGVDVPLWKVNLQGDVTYYVLDGDGNVGGLVDAAGNVVERYSYDSFGERTALLNSSIEQPLGLHARPLDTESGLYYFRSRYYDPDTGRFISEDPDSGAVIDAQTQNPYLFALNDPIRYRDALGTSAEPLNFSGGGGGTLCGVLCLGVSATLSVDTDGNIALKVCGTVGLGVGAKGTISGGVGNGAVSTDFQGSASATAEAGVELGPCQVSIKATIEASNKLLEPCSGTDTTAKGEAGAECAGAGVGGSVSSTNGGDLKIQGGVTAKGEKGEVKARKVDIGAGASASVTAQACLSGGGSVR
ncbi:MAG: RHS repeat-associated core domain-containing protein [Myxococcota bacterium]|nr:RHS repeat-associated core domain-containing protein [Myxococcota bacterium]